MRILGGIGLLAAGLLAACGGGGGGGGTGAATGGTPTAVQITTDNAKPVGADAANAAQNTSAAQGSTGLLTGVQVQGGAAVDLPSTLLIAELVRTVAAGRASAALPAGVVIGPVTEACPSGGTLTLSGNVAGDTGLVAGDKLTISASNCGSSLAGQSTVLGGSLSITVNSGSMAVDPTLYPFSINLSIVTTNLSLTTAGVTQTSNGDLQLAWSATSPTVQSLTASGASLSNGSNSSGTLRTTTWRNYTQTVAVNGTGRSGSLSAAIESTNPRLGTGGGTYAVTTPTTLQWDASTGLASAGAIRVVGRNDSALRLTFAGATATIDVDADGNGSYESTVNTTPSELRSLL